MEQQEFGRTVRRWRDRVAPETVGAPVGTRRRAEGLRREELAALAGISVDYLTRLEQGRATSPSGQVVEALARALRLTDPERELLFRLAGLAVPGRELVPARIPPSVQRMLDRLSENPIAVYDAMWNLLVTNAAYDALTGASAWRGIQRNGVWRNMVGPGPVAELGPDELLDQQAGLVADLRLSAAKYPADPRLRALVSRLRRESTRFSELWDDGEMRLHEDHSRHKFIEHPEAGRIGLDCDTFIVAGDDLRIMIYSAQPGTEDAERLKLAIVLGTQAFAEVPSRGGSGR
ncbi:helix-turn-helix transcriptional regulator [Humibacter ginsengiterrae]